MRPRFGSLVAFHFENEGFILKSSEIKSRISSILPDIQRKMDCRFIYIKVILVNKRDYYAWLIGAWPFPLAVLVVDAECDRFSDAALRGLLAHEMGHFYSTIEGSADWWAINTGFIDDLIQFHREHNSMRKKYKNGEGLTLMQLKKIKKELAET